MTNPAKPANPAKPLAPVRVTLNNINAAIKAEGGIEELLKGDGYFYFTGGNAARWYTSSVMVNRLGALSVAQWVAEWRRMVAEDAKYRTQPPVGTK